MALFGSFQASAEPMAVGSVNWSAMEPGERAFVDRLAADFFEAELHPAQTRKIEKSVAETYRTLDATQQKYFREERRKQWRSLSDAERMSLRGTKTPAFAHLSNARKSVFRAIAVQRLTAGEEESRVTAETEI